MFIHFWERERQRDRVWVGGGAEREGDTESEAECELWAVSTEPDSGLEPMNREIMAWAEVGHLTDWTTQVRQQLYFFCKTMPLGPGGVHGYI